MQTAIEKIRAKNKAAKIELPAVADPPVVVVPPLVDQPPVPPVTHPTPCPTCLCPISWISIYEATSPTPTHHCPECFPPPSPHLVAATFELITITIDQVAGRTAWRQTWPEVGPEPQVDHPGGAPHGAQDQPAARGLSSSPLDDSTPYTPTSLGDCLAQHQAGIAFTNWLCRFMADRGAANLTELAAAGSVRVDGLRAKFRTAS